MYEPVNTSGVGLSRQQMHVVTQLLRVIPSMRHIDEVFQWLAYALVQQFDVQVTQCWSVAANRTGQRFIQLRSMARQDASLPEQVVVNDQMMLIAQRVISEQQNTQPQHTTNTFPQYQALLLRRHGLNYWAGAFLHSSMLLPPRSNAPSQEMQPTPLAMATILFLRQAPSIDLVPTIENILEQAVSLGGNRSLLLPATNVPLTTTPLPPSFAPQTPIPQEASPPLTELIPRRKQDANLLLTSNPFASTAVIADKQARRLHGAIDGRTSIAGLCSTTGMNIKDVYTALQLLLSQDRIEIYEPNGRVVDASRLFNGR